MKIHLILLLLCLSLFSSVLLADDNADGTALKPDVSQPYVVKPGDTLWDIADHFFKDPHRWMQIWERNLYITNPDLIYPGNKIWFDPAAVGKPLARTKTDSTDTDNTAPAATAPHYKRSAGINHARIMTPDEIKTVGGLTLVRPSPRIIVKEVQRVEQGAQPAIVLPELLRRTMIFPVDEDFPTVGYILDSTEPRINYGANDVIYLRLGITPKVGDRFDIFRQGHVVEDIANGDDLGVLMHHLGQIQVIETQGGIYKGRILFAFTEISRGDLLQPAVDIGQKIRPVVSQYNMQGRIVYLQDDTNEVSNNQIVGINLGSRQHLQPGMRFSVFRQGREVTDQHTGNVVQLPKERIAQLVVLSATSNAAMAIVTEARSPINLGDSVRPYGR